MSGVARFLFDECIGKPLMETLHQMVMTDAVFVHVCDYFRQGVLDNDWIPRIGAEGGWVVITSDGGKNSRRGEKLPDLCRDHGITHVILSAKLHTKKSHEKVAALAGMWEKMAALHEDQAGTRYRLRYKDTKNEAGEHGLAVVLERVNPAPPPVTDEKPGQPGKTDTPEKAG